MQIVSVVVVTSASYANRQKAAKPTLFKFLTLASKVLIHIVYCIFKSIEPIAAINWIYLYKKLYKLLVVAPDDRFVRWQTEVVATLNGELTRSDVLQARVPQCS